MYGIPYRHPSIKNKRLQDPHVVILGAGASIAACKIDKNGKTVPALSNIHKVLGLTDMLNGYGFQQKNLRILNFFFRILMERESGQNFKIIWNLLSETISRA